MDDIFGGKLTGGPLAGILDDYSSNKLLSKTRITKSERDEYESQTLKEKENAIKKRKNLKRKKLGDKDLENYILPNKVAKKMKYSNPSSYHKYIKRLNKKIKNKKSDNNNDDDDDDEDIEIETKKFTKSILLGSSEANTKLLNSLDSLEGNKNNPNKTINSNNNNELNNNSENNNATNNDKMYQITKEEVVKRLRELRQPILYFGETDNERLKRLRHLEILEHEREEHAAKGIENEFGHTIKSEVEKELEAAMAQSMNQKKKDIDGDLDEYQLAMQKVELRKTKYDAPRPRSSFNKTEDFVLFFFKRMLREWEQSLLKRLPQEKQSKSGKNATVLQKQARRDIRALFKQLKNRTVPKDVLIKSEKMVFASEKRNYVEAKRIFFEMAIGNAPWPMGVTMVGIHERSGRSKIFSSQIAHVLNDEIQRKYIHAMARLISFCQKKYPNNDPSYNMG